MVEFNFDLGPVVKPEPEKPKNPLLEYESVDELLIAFGKPTGAKNKQPTRATVPAEKPDEKSFVSFHYFSKGEEKDNDSWFVRREEKLHSTIHFFVRPGDTWGKLLQDAKDEKKYHPERLVVAHDHAWSESCSGAPKVHKCREIQ